MLALKQIVTPTLILDEQKCKAHIESMALKAQKHRLIFRPHFKTHQSSEIGNWFKDVGVTRITCSSLQMAAYFAQAGWQDITVAFPVNLREMDLINDLAQKINLNLLVEAVDVVEKLSKGVKYSIGLFIKIDTGFHRTGILPEQIEAIDSLIDEMRKYPHFQFRGFLTHAGHTYQARSKNDIIKIHEDSLERLVRLKKRYQSHFPELMVSIGDTPSCSVAQNFSGADEIRPGNFVFYDVMQWVIGSCALKDIAVAVASPVVAKHADRLEIVLFAGAVHLSKEQVQLPNGQMCYGLLTELTENGWVVPQKLNPVLKLSQEHAVARVDLQTFQKIQTGDLVAVLPVHSCLTANLMKKYLTLQNRIIERWQ